MNNFAKFIISSTIGFFSLSAIAATGPSINSKTLSITLHSPANITANWVAESDLTPAKIMQPETLVGVISLSNTSIETATIRSTKPADASQQGVITFENGSGDTFGATISTNNSNVSIEKRTGESVISSTTQGAFLPSNLDLNVKTTSGNTTVSSGQYNAVVSITTQIK
ncbi:TPA: hypothetical protein J4O53_004830 [Escherichia coli]|nr:hypothetical protein [Escherichia coli]HBA5434936.1 hypothetical protein [Escherichia coli]HBA5491840.1 hypothetical protein [Escherichia coli]HBA5842421.1 hypothetical protein [Escherichia coli]HBA5866160.1 hypothetical protein [Escherichia coli]